MLAEHLTLHLAVGQGGRPTPNNAKPFFLLDVGYISCMAVFNVACLETCWDISLPIALSTTVHY